MLPAHKSARAPASTLYELLFPLMGSPTIMKPWRTSIISYTCRGQESHSLTWHKSECFMLCEWKWKSPSCIQIWHKQISALCWLTKALIQIRAQFSLKQFKKSFSPGILSFSLLNVVPQLQQQHWTGHEALTRHCRSQPWTEISGYQWSWHKGTETTALRVWHMVSSTEADFKLQEW